MRHSLSTLILLLSMLHSITLGCITTLYVDGNNTNGPWKGTPQQPYRDIQTAVDNASSGDCIQVNPFLYCNAIYHAFTFERKALTIYSPFLTKPIINGGTSSIVVDMSNISSTTHSAELRGFTITGSSTAIGVKITDCDCLTATIEDNDIEDLGTGIYAEDNTTSIDFFSNTLSSNAIALHNYNTSSSQGVADIFTDNRVYNNTTGLKLNRYSYTSGNQNLLYDNTTHIDMVPSLYTSILRFDRCTIASSTSSNSNTGIQLGAGDILTLTNSIVYNNATSIINSGGTANVTWSNIQSGFSGTGNINEDPLFCMETGYKFHIMEGSPCIDTGDPNTTGADVRIDMGCFETTTDVKECEGQHWNWVSYPRLNRLNNGPVDATTTLPELLDWPFHLEMLHNIIWWQDPTLEYTIPDDWTPPSYYVQSSLGYKLNPDETGDHYLPTLANATRLSATWTIDYLPAASNWLGYWLPYTQNIEDAFGDFFQYVVSVEAEDWYYEFSKIETPSSSTTNKNMVYGKGYIITFDRDISDFGWTDPTSRGSGGSGVTRPEPQVFSFDDLPNYEVIDVMDIPANVLEIGVFEGDVCVGAVVVQDSCEQMLAYTTLTNRNSTPLTFQYITNERTGSRQVTDYSVMNKKTGVYENRSLISGMQKSSVVRFENLPTTQPGTPAINRARLHGNYPNPFNPTTTISFSLPQEQHVALVIYNTRGQMVRSLLLGDFTAGEHSAVWDGKDDTGNSVGSGIYFYKLITDQQMLSQKMVLLK